MRHHFILSRLPRLFYAATITVILLLSAEHSTAQSAGLSKLSVLLLHNTNTGPANTADAFVVAFAQGFLAGIGPEDSYKFTNLDENLAVDRNGTTLSIEGRPPIAGYDTVPIKVWQYRNTSYCLKLVGVNFPSTTTAVLKDNYLQQDFPIDLTTTTIIQYNLTNDPASYDTGRLCIVFKPASTMPLGITGLNAWQKEKGIQLEWKTQNDLGADKYVIERSRDGIQFAAIANVAARGVAATENYTWNDMAPLALSNFYRIRLLNKTSGEALSSIVKVDMSGRGGSSIAVFPNPVKGTNMGLQLQNIEKGDYKLIIYNSAGQPAHTQTLRLAGGSATETLHLSKPVKAGAYTLLLIKDQSKLSTRVIFD